jgi:hypothetical protein
MSGSALMAEASDPTPPPPPPPLPAPPPPTGPRLVNRALLVVAAMGILGAIGTAVVIAAWKRASTLEDRCGSEPPVARLESYRSQTHQSLATLQVEMTVANRTPVPIQIETIQVDVVQSPQDPMVGQLHGGGSSIEAGATATYTIRGSVVRKDRIVPATPSGASVVWKPTDSATLVRCGLWSRTRSTVIGGWPPCNARPVGSAPPCPQTGLPTTPATPPGPPTTADPAQRVLLFRPGPRTLPDGPVPPMALLSLVRVVPAPGCPTGPAAPPPSRGRYLAVTLRVQFIGTTPVGLVTPENVSVTGPGGARDEDVTAFVCDPGNFHFSAGAHGDGWTFVIDTRHATGTLSFTHPELAGSASWAF